MENNETVKVLELFYDVRKILKEDVKTECPSEEELYDFVFGELADDRRFAIHKHMISCKNCLKEAVFLERMAEAEKRYPLKPPDDLGKMPSRILDAIQIALDGTCKEKS